jgi:phosphoribosylaminoimidazolecarboxamide formyltransferase/IMP cyclohydrolase
MKFKNALVSVSDKTGLVDFLKPMVTEGLRIVSTGGTYKHLKEAGFKVVDISEQTDFPEILDGRVKTLHPKVHMAVLARQDDPEHRKVLKDYQVEPFDLVICNLYPFEQTLQAKKPFEDLIENIDIGGPTLLRAAAKNYHSVTVICDPQDYSWIQAKAFGEEGMAEADRLHLAAKVFSHCSGYDSVIAETLEAPTGLRSIAGRLIQTLRYGENPQQKALWYAQRGSHPGLHEAQILQGKELSYNNLLDLDASIALLRAFSEPCVVAVKHNNPCGVGIDVNPQMALEKAMKADPVSVFGGIVALNFKIEKPQAELLAEIFLECIIAPEVSDEAAAVFAKKKNLRILSWKALGLGRTDLLSPKTEVSKQVRVQQEIRSIFGGFLVQDKDAFSNDSAAWKVIGSPLSETLKKDLLFGEKICGFLKSNSIAIVSGGQSLGLGMGQVNRVDAVEQALSRWKTHHSHHISPCLVSDAFFPFRDSIDLIAQSGVKIVLHPGGSLRDEEVNKAAQENGITIVLTGQRHFRH